ncbi:MAG: molybdopterin cofactor-binding domain-containing protein, partial [Actinomycetota bacterium]
MADEAYRAVFLRVHPTGKMVLSLTTDSDGKEPQYAELVAKELGVPALDVKIVAADTDRFGVGHGYNTSPSDGTPAAISSASAKIRDKARLLAGMALDASPETLTWSNGSWVAGDG